MPSCSNTLTLWKEWLNKKFLKNFKKKIGKWNQIVKISENGYVTRNTPPQLRNSIFIVLISHSNNVNWNSFSLSLSLGRMPCGVCIHFQSLNELNSLEGGIPCGRKVTLFCPCNALHLTNHHNVNNSYGGKTKLNSSSNNKKKIMIIIIILKGKIGRRPRSANPPPPPCAFLLPTATAATLRSPNQLENSQHSPKSNTHKKWRKNALHWISYCCSSRVQTGHQKTPSSFNRYSRVNTPLPAYLFIFFLSSTSFIRTVFCSFKMNCY